MDVDELNKVNNAPFSESQSKHEKKEHATSIKH